MESQSSVERIDIAIAANKRAKVTVAILFLVNLLNYMDRFTIAGIPLQVIDFYSINNEELGLLQTMFFISYAGLSPFAGYFGDRWSRKYIMLTGLILWTVVTFSSSFVPPNSFKLFLLTRCLVGVGEASYSTIAPTIITDLYVGSSRIKVLGLFYFAVPVGSGLGYIFGSTITDLTQNWQWSLRVTPILGVVCIIILVIFHRDPPRGLAEGASHMRATNWLADIKSLATNPSYILVTFGFTCVCFILGALTWFAVDFIELALGAASDDKDAWKRYNVPLIFGASTCLAGITGVLFGAWLSRLLYRYVKTSDALVCGTSLIVCGPVLFLTLLTPSLNFYVCVLFVFIVEFLLCITWAPVSDMIMSVVVPTRRGTASALQMIATHVLGDCISPVIVGAISVSISNSASLEAQYISLQRALFLTPFVCVVGGFFFLFASLFLLDAKQSVAQIIEDSCQTMLIEESDFSTITMPSSVAEL